jgi:hypothetical protein
MQSSLPTPGPRSTTSAYWRAPPLPPSLTPPGALRPRTCYVWVQVLSVHNAVGPQRDVIKHTQHKRHLQTQPACTAGQQYTQKQGLCQQTLPATGQDDEEHMHG